MESPRVIPFETFMQEALYGPVGFYTSGLGRAGRRGDFLTSPEVGPLFGAVVANFLDTEWERIGRPDPFTVVDAGAGPGTLARAVLAAQPRCSGVMRYVAVDLSEDQRSNHPPVVISQRDLPDGPFDGVIIANELLDNLPFRLAVYDDGWREAFVADIDAEQPSEESDRDADRASSQASSRASSRASTRVLREVVSAAFDPVPAVLPVHASLGSRAPLQDAASRWVNNARALLRSGSLVVIDYAVPTTAELANRPWRDWLRTYRGHERGGHYLADPGSQDITTDVCIDQLPEPDAVRTQGQWLQLHGIDELVAAGKQYWAEHAARPDLAAMKMRSRISESEALLDPKSLGNFVVLEWRSI